MSVVVERGLARCPRCVAVADYTFVESGPNSVRYEVHCGKCGAAYCEVNSPVAPDFTAASMTLAAPPPDVGTVVGTRRRRTLAHLAHARARASAMTANVPRPNWPKQFRRRSAEPSPHLPAP